MRKFDGMKKLLSLLLCAVLVMGMLPIPALAAEGDSCTSTPDCTGTYDADGICMVCGAAVPAAGDGAGDSDNEETCQHSGGTATCTAQAVCELCGAPYGELADHAYGTDADGKCDVCGGDCAHAEYAEGVCTVCGGLEPHAHTYVDGVCGCGAECAHENYAEGVCTVCGKTEPHIHTYVDGVCGCGEVCVHAEYVEGVCTVCGGLEPVAPTCVCEVSCGGDNGINPDCTVCLEDFWNCTHFVPTCSCTEKCSEEEPNLWCAICGTEGAEKCEGEDKGIALDEHKHTLNGGKELTWTPITKLSDIQEAGNYYLTASGDLTSNQQLNVNGTVNLCLNGYNITKASLTFIVAADTTLNVCDCVESSTGSIGCKVENNGTLNIYSGAFAISNDKCIINNATMNVYGGTITNTSGNGIQNTGTLTITGGTITAKGHCIYHEGSNATISGNPTITSTGYYGTIDARGNMTIEGGTIQNTDSSYAVGNTGGMSAILTISGGTFTASGSSTVYSRYGTINITAGNFTASTNKNVLDVNAAVNVSGGTFSSGTSQAIVYMYSNGQCALSGGTFKNGIEVKYTKASNYYAYLPQILADGCAYFQNNAAVTVSSSQSKIAGGDVTVAAAPTVETYTVTFDANGGTVSTTSATTNLNCKLDSLPTPTRTHYDFSGWFDAAEGGNQITTDTVFDADKTVYAHWTPKTFTITYVLNGGTILDDPYAQSYTYGVGAELPDNVTKEGYIFRGWADKATGGTYPIGDVGEQASGNKTYYAYWHAHNWTYTASASTEGGPVDTITATCSNTDQMCPNTTGGTVKISASGGTYNGSDHKAELTVSKGWVGNTDISYEYKQNESGSYEGDTDLTKAGYYKASITVDNATAYVEYTVAPKALTEDCVSVSGTLVYDGTAKALTVTVQDGTAGLTEDTDYTVTYKQNGKEATPINAGTYDVVITGKNNYSGTVTKTFTITPKSLTSEDITVSLSDNVIFKGQPTPTVIVKDGNTVLTKDTDYTVSQTESDGEFTLTITGTGNYKGTYGSTLTYLVVTLPDPDKVEPYDEDAINAYNRYTELNKKYQDAELAEKLEELQKALTDYKITKGHKSRYVKTSYKTLTFTANGPVSKFSYIEVDGKQVDAKHYTVAPDNGTVITLKTSYLETLSAGKHTIQVFYADGKTDTATFRISINNGNPFTGDDPNMLLFGGVAMTSLLCIAMMVMFYPRKKGKYER